MGKHGRIILIKFVYFFAHLESETNMNRETKWSRQEIAEYYISLKTHFLERVEKTFEKPNFSGFSVIELPMFLLYVFSHDEVQTLLVER